MTSRSGNSRPMKTSLIQGFARIRRAIASGLMREDVRRRPDGGQGQDLLFGQLLASPDDGLPDGEIGGADDPVVADQERGGDDGDGARQEDHPAQFPDDLARMALAAGVFSLPVADANPFFIDQPVKNRRSSLPDDPDLGLQGMPRRLEHPLLNQVDQAEDLLRGRPPPVDDEIAMFFRYLRVTDPQSP